MRYLLTVSICFLTAFAAIGQSANKMAAADSLFQNYHEDKALEAYNKILEQDADNFVALWRSSLLYSRLGNQFDSEDKQNEYYNTGRTRAKRALAVDSAHTQSNYVMSVAMGRKALIVGARERVEASRDIKEFAERSLAADSTNEGAWHVLGRWNYEISDLNFAERLAANVLFGGIPEGASLEKAVKYYNKAIELNPKFLLYYYDLAKAYDELGREDKAVETCNTAIERPVVVPHDEKLKDDCRKLINDLS